MRIRLGCRLSYRLPQAMPMIALLNVHFSRFADLDRPDYLVTTPSVPSDSYRDALGNWCSRLVAPALPGSQPATSARLWATPCANRRIR